MMKCSVLCLTLINWSCAALLYTTNSEYGIFMAISVPISLPHRNVFLSYNYEFNYYQPEHVYKYPPILMGDFEESYLTYPTSGREAKEGRLDKRLAKNSTISKSTNKSREKRALSLMTRSTFYIMLKDKIARSGYPAKDCLLRLICETNASSLGEVNGFLGSLLHIIFSPSSSQDEYLPPEYYQAEWQGHQHQDCSPYTTHCSANILDLISVPVEQLLNELRERRK